MKKVFFFEYGKVNAICHILLTVTYYNRIFHLKRHPIEEKNCQMVNVKNKQSSHDKKKSVEEDVRVILRELVKIFGLSGLAHTISELL